MFGEDMPVWLMAICFFCARIVDVSIGTFRTIAVVQGWITLSVCLGFFEVLIWVLVVSQVFKYAVDNPFLLIAYAAGFATGNAVGIQLERRLALGIVILRIITSQPEAVIQTLHQRVAHVTTFAGKDEDQDVVLLYVACKRRDLRELVAAARAVDQELFYAVDPLRESSIDPAMPLPHATGWRGVFKTK